MPDSPLAYFLSWRTYGTWLPGDARGWVDRRHNAFGTPYAAPSTLRYQLAARSLGHDEFTLGETARSVVSHTIQEVCKHRHWSLHTAHVRTTHCHVILTANVAPERAMNDLKAWGTRRLVEAGIVPRGRTVWTRHGSTKWLWREEQVDNELNYVIREQRAPLAGDCLFVADWVKKRMGP